MVMSATYPCTISSSTLKYFPMLVSFPFVKGSPYVDLFSKGILLLKQSGQVDKLIEQHLSSIHEHDNCKFSSFMVNMSPIVEISVKSLHMLVKK